MIFVGCANTQIISPTYQTAYESILNYFIQGEDEFSRNQIDSIPYASSLISFDNGKRSLVILEYIREDKLSWVSQDKKVFFTKEGRVISSIGLPNNLYSIDMPKISFSELKDNKITEYIAYYSFRNPVLNNLPVRVTSLNKGMKKIVILNKEMELVLIQEEIYSERINWNVTNKFWIDPIDSFVWKSEQFLSPKLPLLKMEITKKPAI